MVQRNLDCDLNYGSFSIIIDSGAPHDFITMIPSTSSDVTTQYMGCIAGSNVNNGHEFTD